MKLISSSKMRAIDRLATEKFGIPSLILMENAGRSVACEAEGMIRSKAVSIAILCGYGNNGGDGFVVARHLTNRGYRVVVYLVGKQKKMSKDTETNFIIIKKSKIRMKRIANQKQITQAIRHIKKSQLLIDAVFGIGVKGGLSSFYCQLFTKINSSGIAVLSIDIPSGLDADKGMPLPIAIKAKKTVTMGLAKIGFKSRLARKYLGRVTVADISLPKQLR